MAYFLPASGTQLLRQINKLCQQPQLSRFYQLYTISILFCEVVHAFHRYIINLLHFDCRVYIEGKVRKNLKYNSWGVAINGGWQVLQVKLLWGVGSHWADRSEKAPYIIETNFVTASDGSPFLEAVFLDLNITISFGSKLIGRRDCYKNVLVWIWKIESWMGVSIPDGRVSTFHISLFAKLLFNPQNIWMLVLVVTFIWQIGWHIV